MVNSPNAQAADASHQLMEQQLIEVVDVQKEFRRGSVTTHVLRGISCRIKTGAMSFIVGPSGSGKSTLLYLLGGLDQPTSGSVRIDGTDITTLSARQLDRFRRQSIGFIFQSFNLLRTLNCVDNVLAPFIPTGVTAAKRQAAEQLLDRVGLGDRLTHRPIELSGGEQQRVAIARAVFKQPKLILADEPTGELDTETGRQVFEILRELNATTGTTIVTVTHDQRYIDSQDTVLQMQDGNFINPPS